MSKDIFRKLKLVDGRLATVLYHYEYALSEAVPVIDNVWDESMEEDITVDSNEGLRLSNIIIATYMKEDLGL